MIADKAWDHGIADCLLFFQQTLGDIVYTSKDLYGIMLCQLFVTSFIKEHAALRAVRLKYGLNRWLEGLQVQTKELWAGEPNIGGRTDIEWDSEGQDLYAFGKAWTELV